MKRALLAVALAAACHSGGPSIDSFTVNKASISPGDAVTFSWKVSGASKLSIDPDVGDVSGTTSVQAHPPVSAIYTLTASNGSGTSTARLNLNVKVSPGSFIFLATPPQAAPGDAVLLRWSVGGATSVSISGVGDQPASGSVVVKPSKTTRYTLTAAGVNPPVGPLDVLVRVAAKPAILTFDVPPTAQPGSDITLSWTATNATSFTMLSEPGVSTFLGPLKTFTVQPSQTTKYTLTANGPTGTTSQGKTVTLSGKAGTSFLYTPPSTVGAAVVLRSPGCPAPPLPCTQVTFTLEVGDQPVLADSVALDLPVPGAARVALHTVSGAPDWQVNPGHNALDPGTNPPAAAIALPSSGPLARVLTLGISQKPAGSGAVASATLLQPGMVLARFTLDLVPSAGPGPVFSPAQAPAFVIRAAGAPQGSLAIGTLLVQ